VSELFDLRQKLFSEHFNKGLDFQSYINSGAPAHTDRWHKAYNNTLLSEDQKKFLATFVRKINILVISGTWCGDCVRQCPIIAKIAENCPTMQLKFLDNQANPELANELRIHGASRVPVAVVLSEDFFEVSRFGDRTLSSYRRKAEKEAGVACDTGLIPTTSNDLEQEISEWIAHFERAHLLLRTSGLLRQRYND
jgi:thiol-disulfide isomerase/thioredoxin